MSERIFDELMRDICEREICYEPSKQVCVEYDWLYDRIQEAIEQRPEGHVLVPVELLERILDNHDRSIVDWDGFNELRAMLKAVEGCDERRNKLG